MKCCLCGCDQIESAYADMVRCVDCKLFIKKQLPNKEEVKIKLKNFLLSACWDKNTRKERMKDAKWQLDQLEEYVKPGKVFDVGAASGFFMKAAFDRGWNAQGNDVSAAAVKWAKENFDLFVYYDFFEDISLPHNEYDAVVLWNTLEHTHNPAETVRIAKNILKPDGFIYIKIPERPTLSLLQKYYEPWHFYEFKTSNVTRFLESEGFVEKKINKYWYHDKMSETEYLFQLKKIATS